MVKISLIPQCHLTWIMFFICHQTISQNWQINQEVFSKGCNEAGLQRIFVFLVMQNELKKVFSYTYKFPLNLFYKTCSPHTSFQVFLFLIFQGTFTFLYLFTFFFFPFFFLFLFHIYTQGCPRICIYTRNTWFSKPQNHTSFGYPLFPPEHINIFLQLKR